MKLLNDTQEKLKEKANLESIVKKKQEIQYEFIDTLKPKSGHTLYKIHKDTLEVRKAEFINKKTITFNEALSIQNETIKDEVLIEQNYVYISALNPENALKRYKENKGSASIPKGKLKL